MSLLLPSLQNPKPSKILFSPLSVSISTPIKLSSLSTLKFPRNFHTLTHSSLQSSSEVGEDYVVGDCIVFEEGIFDDPSLDSHGFAPLDTSSNSNTSKPMPKSKVNSKNKVAAEEILTENLVPDKWREVQAEINITKKDRRKIAQELEFNSRVEKKKKGLVPIRSANLEEYKSYREAKLAQLKPLVLDNPSRLSAKEDKNEEEMNESVSQRVKPKNPRWAVYGRGLDDVTEFFNNGSYEPGQKNSEGKRKLFTKEEKVLLNKRIPDLAVATSGKWLPLHTLAASGDFYLVNALLKHTVDINAVNTDGLTALHKAIICKKQAVTSYLLRESANPFVLDTDGASLLHYAVRTASSPAIKLLLLYNVNINLQDNDGWTPLHLAVQARRTDIVKLLLIRGADKTLKNKDGLTPLQLCLHSGRDIKTYELIKLLKQLPKNSTAVTKNPYNYVPTS